MVFLDVRPSVQGLGPKLQDGEWVVLYHWSTCPHCVALRPAWDEARREATRKGCQVAEVEYSFLPLMPEGMKDVRGFPSIRAYRDGKMVSEFHGDRTPEDLLSFMREFSKPKAKSQSGRRQARPMAPARAPVRAAAAAPRVASAPSAAAALVRAVAAPRVASAPRPPSAAAEPVRASAPRPQASWWPFGSKQQPAEPAAPAGGAGRRRRPRAAKRA